jgi:thiol-disulfide isomerase/thioredoxin
MNYNINLLKEPKKKGYKNNFSYKTIYQPNKTKMSFDSNPESVSVEQFYNILKENKSIVIFKFGADWCIPCKKIEPTVNKWFYDLRDNNIITILVDVDESFELFAFLKTKKMIQGIPAILAYYKGNTSYVFDDSVAGCDLNSVNLFFQRCVNKLLL